MTPGLSSGNAQPPVRRETGAVLFRRQQWPGLADGSITVAFRRWRRATVRAGGTLQSPVGLLAIDEVAVIEPDDVSEADARAAGFPDAATVLGELAQDGMLHRIRFHRLGDDPRIALRERDDLDGDEATALAAALHRLPWATEVLALIAERPGVVSTELAVDADLDRPTFKRRVRRLKELGLTESLATGYRLSPRGAVALTGLREEAAGQADQPPS
jgi:hypothetical protein